MKNGRGKMDEIKPEFGILLSGVTRNAPRVLLLG